MTVHRVMGLETEFGISVPSQPGLNPVIASSLIVGAYGRHAMSRYASAQWDYAVETPLRDARGFDMSRAEADPSQLTDDDPGMANLILTNGARLYVDHAHPEYSAPEVTNPLDAVLWDRAGVEVMRIAMAAARAEGLEILIYKNNTDNKGASYGCHENYLMDRATPFPDIVRDLTPFFVTRQVFTGTGRVGVGQDGRVKAFQLSQRADFFEVEVGLETTLKRPIINTRDEPHADPARHRRLHVIVGDANLSDSATFLKMGTTSIVLAMIESGFLQSAGLALHRPVAEMHAVSHDVSLQHRVALADGRVMTAVQLQREYLRRARDFCGAETDALTRQVLSDWERILDGLEHEPMSLSDELDWVAKKSLMDAYIRRDQLEWSSPRLEMVDIQYSDLRPERGLAARLQARGALRHLVTADRVEWAIDHPPEDTRAYFRGECLRRFPDSIAAASWDSIVFDVPGRDALVRVPTLDPGRGTRAHVGALLDEVSAVPDLLDRLSRDR